MKSYRLVGMLLLVSLLLTLALAGCGAKALPTPENLRVADGILTWDEVPGACRNRLTPARMQKSLPRPMGGGFFFAAGLSEGGAAGAGESGAKGNASGTGLPRAIRARAGQGRRTPHPPQKGRQPRPAARVPRGARRPFRHGGGGAKPESPRPRRARRLPQRRHTARQG